MDVTISRKDGFISQDLIEAVGLLNKAGFLINPATEDSLSKFQFDNSGNLKTTSTGGVGSSVTISDPNTPANMASVDASGALSFNLAKIGGVAQSGANVIDVANSAIQVNVVAGTITISSVDVSDRAGRLLGIVYGNLDQIQQKASTKELLTWDDNLATVFGTGSLLSSGRIKTEANQGTSPWVVSLASTTITGTVAVTQSGSWTVTANAGTNLNTSLLALESGGNLATLAGIVSSSRAAVNPISGQVGVQGNTGVVTALTQRVVLATDVALPTGSNVIGAVTQSGTWNIGTVSTVTNLAQMNGAAITMGNGISGTGVQRVTIASDSTGIIALTTSVAEIGNVKNSGTFAVQATLSAETTKVIGTVNQGTSPWVVSLASTTITGTVAVTQSTSPWVVSLASTTITGTVAVTQSGTWNIGTLTSITNALPSGTNVIGHVITDSGSVVAATLSAETTKVIGVVRNADGSGNLLTSTSNALDVNIKTSSITADVSLKPNSGSTYAPTNSTSTAFETNRVAKASAGNLWGFSGYNSKTSSQFIQAHDAASLPAEGAVPVLVIAIPPLSNFSYDPGEYGRRFSTGIVLCNSASAPVKSIGSADCWFDVQFS